MVGWTSTGDATSASFSTPQLILDLNVRGRRFSKDSLSRRFVYSHSINRLLHISLISVSLFYKLEAALLYSTFACLSLLLAFQFHIVALSFHPNQDTFYIHSSTILHLPRKKEPESGMYILPLDYYTNMKRKRRKEGVHMLLFKGLFVCPSTRYIATNSN